METMESVLPVDNGFSVYDDTCPTRQALDRITDKWTALCIGMLEGEPRRFSELQRCIKGISQKMLTQTLRTLERDGLVQRTVYAQVPPRVEYTLTPLGRTLTEPLRAVREWAERYIPHVLEAQAVFDEKQAK
jgi:DNA-binding HxlR family transcriptional regulator